MTRLRRVLQASAVAAVALCAPAAAQEAPPADDRVAQVGVVAIPRADFDHWLVPATHGVFGRPMELVAPDYAQCVAFERRRRVIRDWGEQSEARLRKRCAAHHRAIRHDVVQFLVQAQWVEQEAKRRGVTVSDRRVERLFQSQRRQAFPDRRGYERFLRRSGASEDDIKYRVRLDALQLRLTRLVTARVRPPTARDVTRYIARHPKAFAHNKPAKARRRARERLASERAQGALGRFIERFHARYSAMTWCAAGYRVAECRATAPPAADG